MELSDNTLSCFFSPDSIVMYAALVLATDDLRYIVEKTRRLVLFQPSGEMLVEGLDEPPLRRVFLAMKNVREAKAWIRSTKCLDDSQERKHLGSRTGATSCDTDHSVRCQATIVFCSQCIAELRHVLCRQRRQRLVFHCTCAEYLLF